MLVVGPLYTTCVRITSSGDRIELGGVSYEYPEQQRSSHIDRQNNGDQNLLQFVHDILQGHFFHLESFLIMPNYSKIYTMKSTTN